MDGRHVFGAALFTVFVFFTPVYTGIPRALSQGRQHRSNHPTRFFSNFLASPVRGPDHHYGSEAPEKGETSGCACTASLLQTKLLPGIFPCNLHSPPNKMDELQLLVRRCFFIFILHLCASWRRGCVEKPLLPL